MKLKVRKRTTLKEDRRTFPPPVNKKKSAKTLYPDLSFRTRLILLIVIASAVVTFLFYPDILHYWKLMKSNELKIDSKNTKTSENDFKHQSQPVSPPKEFEKESQQTRNKRSAEYIEENANVKEEVYGKPDEVIEMKQQRNDPMESEVSGDREEELTSEPRSTPVKLTRETVRQPDKLSAHGRSTKSSEKASGRNDGHKQNLPKEVTEFKPTYLKKITQKKVFIDGRRIPPIELLHQKPNNSSIKVYLFNEFLSDDECDALVRVHDKHVAEFSKEDPIICFDTISTLRKHLKAAKKKNLRVNPTIFTAGTTCVNASFSTQLKQWFNGNWSYSTAFYPGESRFSHIFANRVKEAMGLSPENGGKFQITSYPEGIGYKTHTDCIVGSEDKRDRVATILVYLKDVEEGGETKFPDLGIWVKPRKGRALVWTNMNEKGECEPASVHDASRVIKGQKYILQRWYYYQSFYSLGKRPPEPHLPIKKSGQPRVSCDEYDHGSCRWYDEWNYEHLLDYQRQKATLI